MIIVRHIVHSSVHESTRNAAKIQMKGEQEYGGVDPVSGGLT